MTAENIFGIKENLHLLVYMDGYYIKDAKSLIYEIFGLRNTNVEPRLNRSKERLLCLNHELHPNTGMVLLLYLSYTIER